MSVEAAYRVLYLVVLLAFCIMIGIMLIRSVLTRGVCEKIVCVNMLSTMVICAIAILSRMLDEAYLLDVALIYAMISFVAVLMMASMFVPSSPREPKLDEETAAGDGKEAEQTDERASARR
jgi:multicomponent Na+:H+ antiporter subunit F